MVLVALMRVRAGVIGAVSLSSAVHGGSGALVEERELEARRKAGGAGSERVRGGRGSLRLE